MDEIEKYFDICCEYYDYVYSQSLNENITILEAEGIFTMLLSNEFEPMYLSNTYIIEGIKFYQVIFDKIIKITKYQDIIDIIEYFLITNANSPYLASNHNIIQFVMKIIIHLIWQKIIKFAPKINYFILETKTYDNPKEFAQKEIVNIMNFLKEKHNTVNINNSNNNNNLYYLSDDQSYLSDDQAYLSDDQTYSLDKQLYLSDEQNNSSDDHYYSSDDLCYSSDSDIM